MNRKSLFDQRKTRKYYKCLNNSHREFRPRLKSCRDINGQILHDTNSVLNRWVQHFSEHLNANDVDEHDNIENQLDKHQQPHTEIPTREEVSKVNQNLKNNKSPGIDEICSEMYKQGGEQLLEVLHKLIVLT